MNVIDLDQYRELAEARLTALPLFAGYGPEFFEQAACAGEPGKPRSWKYVDDFFVEDDITEDFTKLPETIQRKMETCYDCPVRRQCLEYAYDHETHIDDEDKLKPKIVEDDTRFGVWGGIPGRFRARFAHEPDRLDVCEEWFQTVAHRLRWGYAAVVDDLFESKRDEPPREELA